MRRDRSIDHKKERKKEAKSREVKVNGTEPGEEVR